ncbi:Protein O-mannosyltransferase 2, partial [Nowakowskiella sp. JEL0078]
MLRHVTSGCLLRSHAVTLPEWGFKQAEVVCQKKGDPTSSNNWWNIEQHWNDKLPAGGKGLYPNRFFNDFLSLNVAMWSSNNALTPDPDKEPDALTSTPIDWPLMRVGLRMCGWDDGAIKFWLIGHPIAWLGSTVCLIIVVFGALVVAVRWQRNYQSILNGIRRRMGQLMVCWESWLRGLDAALLTILDDGASYVVRIRSNLHHYFPALYFGIITFAVVVDHLTNFFPKRVKSGLMVSLMIAITGVYLYFQDFALGFTGPAIAYSGRRWFK